MGRSTRVPPMERLRIGGNAMEFELLADSIKQINDKASSAAKSAVNQL